MRVLYVRIPKTASSSISKALCQLRDKGSVKYNPHQHTFIEEIYKEYGKRKLKNSLILGSVRNPYDRLWSAYSYIKTYKIRNPKYSFMKSFSTFQMFCCCLSQIKDRSVAFKPQTCWLVRKNKKIYHYLIRYETLQKDWKRFLKNNNLPQHPLKCLRFSNTQPWQSVYTPSLKKLVYQIYKDDFKYFGYKK